MPFSYTGPAITASKTFTATLNPCVVTTLTWSTTSPTSFSRIQGEVDLSTNDLTVTQSPNCGYPVVYTNNALPAWIQTDGEKFKIVSSTSTQTSSQSFTITKTATLTLPAGMTAVTSTNNVPATLTVRCTVTGFQFSQNPVDFSSVETMSNQQSTAFDAAEVAPSCSYPVTYSYNSLPSWITYNTGTKKFTINSASVTTPTAVTQTHTITMTAALTLPTYYPGTSPV